MRAEFELCQTCLQLKEYHFDRYLICPLPDEFPRKDVHCPDRFRQMGALDLVEFIHKKRVKPDGIGIGVETLLGTKQLKNGRWMSVLNIDGKDEFLGYFTTEIEAYNSYIDALEYVRKFDGN